MCSVNNHIIHNNDLIVYFIFGTVYITHDDNVYPQFLSLLLPGQSNCCGRALVIIIRSCKFKQYLETTKHCKRFYMCIPNNIIFGLILSSHLVIQRSWTLMYVGILEAPEVVLIVVCTRFSVRSPLISKLPSGN